MEKISISIGQLLRQLLNDFTGKDSQSGYTYTYVWMANQLGHFALGFVFVSISGWFFIESIKQNPFGVYALVLLAIMALWLVYEIINTWSSINHALKEASFKPDVFQIVFDAITDVFIIWLGAFSAYFGLYNPVVGLCVFWGGFVIVFIVAMYWLKLKMYFQQGDYPSFNRLSDLQVNLSESDKEQIMLFTQLKSKWKVLLIFGKAKSGRTSLASAIATEHALKDGITRYTTLFKLIQLFQTQEPYSNKGVNQIWPWRSAEILVVDDVEPSTPGISPVSIDTISNALDLAPFASDNVSALRNNTSVWVMGLPDNISEWQKLFVDKTIVSNTDEVGVIVLE